jgi:hypothetical protein
MHNDTLDAVRAVKAYIEKISTQLQEKSTGWASVYDNNTISELMCFTENGQEQYVIFGSLAGDGKLDLIPHEKLFWLANDLGVLKLLTNSQYKRNPPDVSGQIQDYCFRLSVNTIYLIKYLASAEKKIQQGTFQALRDEEPNKAQEISNTTQKTYLNRLRNIFEKYKNNKEKMSSSGESGDVTNIPVIPVVVSYKLSEETDRLNVYMTKEMADQMRERLATIQAQAFSS